LLSRSSNTFRSRARRAECSFWSILAGLAAICCAVSAFAIDPNRTISQYIHISWGAEKGFPGGSVSSIAQTPDGYLWIGTDNGLVRFDGASFRNFEQAEPASFAIGPVRKLLADTQGNLWVLLENTKLLRYRDGHFNLMRGEAENGVTALGQGADNSVLLSSLAMGVLLYKNERFVRASESLASGQNRNEVPPDFTWSTGLAVHRLIEPTAAVISLASTNDGKIWLGTADRGLFFVNEGGVHAVSSPFPKLRINCILPVSSEELWIGTNKGVLLWNGKELTRGGLPSALSGLEVLSVIRDRDSNIWVGTAQTLVRVNDGGVSSFARPAASRDRVTAIFEDREGNLWIGGAEHIDCLHDSAFVTYSLPHSESAGALFADSDDYTWIAPTEGGLLSLTGGKYASVSAAGLDHDVVYSISGARPDSLWLGRQKGGLTHLLSVHGAVTAKTYTQSDGLAQNSVYSVLETRDGSVWSGTLTAGVSQLRNGRFTNYTTANGLASNAVSAIVEDSDGTIWLGTPNGLSAMSGGNWRTYKVTDGLPSEDIYALLPDSDGNLWIGTAEGTAYFSAGRIHTLAADTQSLREPVFGIAEDKSGGLWIATSSHVLRVKRPADKLLTDADVREYGLADGLQATEGVKRDKSVVVDSHGRIWLSTSRGLSSVNPARAAMNSAPALVGIEAVLQDGESLDLRNPPRVMAGQAEITFRYFGLSLADADRVRYRYRLDGFDKDWSEPEATREASYGNLAAGHYRFRVLASNSDGQWNSSEAVVGLDVEPRLWETWWFRSALVLCAGLAGVAVYRIRMQRLTRLLSVRFEERLAERTRIAQDLHDTLLQGIYSASIHFDLANHRLPQDSPAKSAMQRGLELLRQVSQDGRKALRSLRSSQPTSDVLEQALFLLPKEFALPEDIDFLIATEGLPRALRPLVRDEAYLIAREAIINAFRHAHATKIEVEVDYASRNFRVMVRDNGCGIGAEVLKTGREGHWGLAGMRERAEKINARLEVSSGINAGTEVELLVPGALAYQDTSSHQYWSWLPRFDAQKADRTLHPSSKEPPE
jgi:ligand-binding sensor domain-containing protein/signal transduction histidine kinase